MTRRRMPRDTRRAAPRTTLDGSSPASRGPEPLTTYRERLDDFLSLGDVSARQPVLEITVETRTRVLRSAVIRYVERGEGSSPDAQAPSLTATPWLCLGEQSKP